MNKSKSLTKSTLAFARTALNIAKSSLPAYSCPKSPHKFTQHQLLTILALKIFLKADYRGIVIMLAEWSDLRRVLKLNKRRLPNYSTLCKAQQRFLKKGASKDSLLEQSYTRASMT